MRTHCKRGHEMAGENVYTRKDGGRQCRECVRIRVAAHRDRKKAEEARRVTVTTSGAPQTKKIVPPARVYQLLPDDVDREHYRPCDFIEWTSGKPCRNDFCWVLCGQYVCADCMGMNNLEQWKTRFRRGEFKPIKGPHYTSELKEEPMDRTLAEALHVSRLASPDRPPGWQTIPDSKAIELEGKLKKQGLRTRWRGGRLEVMYGGWQVWISAEDYPMHALPE